MDEDLIEALADAFAEQLAVEIIGSPKADMDLIHYGVLWSINKIACVINDYQPSYDLRYFYKRAGYPKPYPEHPIRGEEDE